MRISIVVKVDGFQSFSETISYKSSGKPLTASGNFSIVFMRLSLFSVNISEVARTIVILGVALIALGVILPYMAKLDFFRRLPGDIKIERENFSFYFPIATCIVLSILLTFLGNLFFRK